MNAMNAIRYAGLRPHFYRLLTASAICVLLLPTLPAAAQAQDYTYTTNGGSITITAYIGSGGDVTIPGAINGRPVTRIGGNAFSWTQGVVTSVTITNTVTSIESGAFFQCSYLASVSIPDSVTNIGASAFRYDERLTSVKIGNGLTSIGSSVFEDCSGLKEMTIPSSVKSIGQSAFRYCTSMTNAAIPSSVTSIGDYAFQYCRSLTSVTIPSGVTSIRSFTFDGCSQLSGVTIPDSVTSIGGSAFQGCASLASFTIGKNVNSLGAGVFGGTTNMTAITVDALNSVYSTVDGILSNKGRTMLIECPGGKAGSYTIPDGVTGIGDAAFQGCTALIYVTIPESVTSIGSSTFSGCTGLTGVTLPSNVTSIQGSMFQGCASLTSFAIPTNVTSIGYAAFVNCTRLASVTIPGGLTGLGAYAFQGCASLTGITIPAGVTSIGPYTFQGCPSLASIDIPDGVTSIGNSAFASCAGLTSVIIPEKVISIGESAFYFCTGLTKAFIGHSVTSIGDGAFYYCPNLTGVYFQGVATYSAGSNMFYYDTHATIYYPSVDLYSGWGAPTMYGRPAVLLPFRYSISGGTVTLSSACYTGSDSDVTVPDNIGGLPVTGVGSQAFYCSATLTSVTIPDSVISIGGYAFWQCPSLTNAVIGNGVTSIGEEAFYGCGSLASAVIGNSVTNIGDRAFFSCGSLGYIAIPDSVISIGDQAFTGCGSLTCVTVGNHVANIGDYGFASCDNLLNVYFRGDIPTDGSSAFDGNSPATFYYLFGAFGWDVPFSGHQAVLLPFDYTVSNGAVTVTGYTGSYGDVTIPDTINGLPVTGIGDHAFDANTNLAAIAISASVASIGTAAFAGCTNLTDITVDAGNSAYSSAGGVLFDSAQTTFIQYPTGRAGDYTIPDGITVIGADAFAGCEGLSSVTIPDTVTDIGDRAFQDCTSLTNITIPDTVTDIGDHAFQGCAGLTSMTLGSKLTCLGIAVFQDCTGLARITIPYGINTIGASAFQGCSGLISVTIADSVTHIGDYAFAGCGNLTILYFGGDAPDLGSDVFAGVNAAVYYPPGRNGWDVPYGGLTAYAWSSGYFCALNGDGSITVTGYDGPGGDVTIPDSLEGRDVTVIGAGAFSNCTALASVAIPDSVTGIGDTAFCGCSNLTGVAIGSGLSNIGYHAFFACPSLGAFTVNSSNTTYSSPDGVLYDLNQTMLVLYPAGKRDTSYTISNGVSRIGEDAFACSTNLVSVTVPASVTWVSDEAFVGCTSLRYLYFGGEAPWQLGGDAFAGVDATICYPPGANGWDVSFGGLPAYAWSSGFFCALDGDGNIIITGYDGPGGDVTIPDSLEGRNVTMIGAAAFSNCTALVSVAIPVYVTEIGDTAFCGCRNLTGVTTGSGLANIGYHAFFACPSLCAFTVSPSNTTYSSPDGVLYDLNQTMLVLYPAGKSDTVYTVSNCVSSVGSDAFAGSTHLVSVTVPASVWSIADGAFAGCVNLRSLYFGGDAPWQLGSDVFAGVDATIYYPPGANGWDVSYRGLSAYARSSGFLCSVNWGANSIIIIGYDGPGGTVAIPASIGGRAVTVIADGAFSNCTSLTSLAIPSSVTSIGSRAVMGCGNLAAVSVDAENTTYSSSPDGVLYNLDTTTLLLFPAGRPDSSYAIPDGVLAIGAFAFSGNTNLVSAALPASVTSIGSGPFCECPNLTDISVDPANPSYSSVDGVLFGATSGNAHDLLVQYPAGKSGSSYQIPDGTLFLGAYAFSGCSHLTQVASLDGLIGIGDHTFYDCALLTTFVFGQAWWVWNFSIGDQAFAGCPRLTALFFDNRAPDFGADVFAGEDMPLFYCMPGTTGWDDFQHRLWRYPFYCSTNDDGTVAITGYLGAGGDESIPDSINDIAVTRIADAAFSNCVGLTSLYIPPNVNTISDSAFYDCTDLAYFNVAWDNPTFRSGGDGVLFDKAVTKLLQYPASKNQPWEQDYSIPDSVTAVRSRAFANATNLLNVGISSSVAVIPTDAFAGCVNLLNLYVDGGNGVYSSSDGVLLDKAGTTLIRYPGGRPDSAYTLPDGVSAVGSEAFAGCANLTSVTIPVSVSSLADGAFAGCTGLTDIYFLGAAPTLGADVFAGVAATVHYLPANSGWGAGLFGGLQALAWYPQFVWTLNSDGTVTITGYNGAGGMASIPDAIEGHTVTCIGNGAFANCGTLTDLLVPASVTNVADSAFANCGNLARVVFAGAVPAFGTGVFDGDNLTVCYAFAQESWKTLPEGFPATAYWNAPYVYTVDEGSGTATIVRYLGAGGSETLPSALSDLPVACIGRDAFNGCATLTNAVIQEGVVTIDGGAFYNCTGLIRVTIPAGVAIIGDSAFCNCASLAGVGIPDGVTFVGNWAFSGCSALPDVSIPGSVAWIGYEAFNQCTNLSTILVALDNPCYTNVDGVLFDSQQHALLQYPPARSATVYAIPAGTLTLADSAFANCGNLINVTVPEGATAIGSWTFQGCANLSAISFPDSLASIGNAAFTDCANLLDVAIPDSVTQIGWSVFQNCTSLRDVKLSEGLTSTGSDWFFNCTSLRGLTLPDSIASIGYNCFANCSSLTNITLPNGVTRIGDGAFYNCSSLDNITIPDTVTKIENSAFSGCSALTGIVIPAGVTALGDYTFYGCSGLTALYFEGGMPTIGQWTFYKNWWGELDPATIYYLSSAAGWGAPTFGDLQTAVWSLTQPRIVADAAFGVQAGHFGFRITGESNQVVVVDACTNLANPVWVPLGTNTLTGGASIFGDSDWSNHPVRFYRVHTP